MKAIYYGDTNIGNIRPKNEDAFVLKEIGGGTYLIAVCVDGVGGNGGDVAANLACKCIADYFNDLTLQTDCLESLMSPYLLKSEWRNSLMQHWRQAAKIM